MKTKTKYNTAQNAAWMIRIAWNTAGSALVYCTLMAALEILYNLTQLFIAPRILHQVESGSSVGALLGTIGFFTLALFALSGAKAYVDVNTLFPGVDIRTAIVGMLGKKCNSTSYPNTLEPQFIKLREHAHRACDGNEEATERIWKTLSKLLTNVGGFVIYLTILSRLDALLLAVVMITCVIGFLAYRYADQWVYARRDQEEDYYVKKRYIREKSESVTLAKDIRIFGLQPWLMEVLDRVHNVYLDFRLREERVRLLVDLTAAILTVARNGVAYWYLLNMALTENLGVPEFLLYFTAVSTFTSWIMGILQEAADLHRESLDISTVREFLEYPEPFRFEGGKAVPQADSYELRLEHVSYRYPQAQSDTIRDLSLTVAPGERLAVVGLNGAGKTTLVRLLCGLLDPTAGRVLLNGQDIRAFNRREYYRLFSAVFQDFSILDVTVAETVAQTAVQIDNDRVRACLDQAGLLEFVQELPQGLQTHVGREVYLDGVLFSGGQTQRLMLARALYKNGAVLLLDEPTAALDPLAENDIYRKYRDMTAGKTALFISHRLASTRFCDRIILLSGGGIAEEGTHDSLMALGGAYAELFEVQSRYYREGREF